MSTESAVPGQAGPGDVPPPPFVSGGSAPAPAEASAPSVPAPSVPEPPFQADPHYKPPAEPERSKPAKKAAPPKPALDDVKLTRTSAAWASVITGALLLIVVLVFIVQNTDPATLYFLKWQISLPLGVLLLFAVIAGVLGTALVGAARIFQLRRAARKIHKAALQQ